MDDLLGEDWQRAPKPKTAPLNPSTFASNYSSLRPSPQPPRSGTQSPQNISRPSSTVNNAGKIGSKPPTPANDAFGNLTSLKSQKAANNVSIQERQRQLVEERRRQQEQQASMWDSLGSGRGTPEIRAQSPAITQRNADDEDDILAAFNKNALVDRASHYPPPSSGVASGRTTPASAAPAPISTGHFDDDDDPFGLAEVSKRSNGHAYTPSAPAPVDEDDILGDLGRPVTERRPKASTPTVETPEWDEDIAQSRRAQADEPQDQALAELVDMGFPADTAKLALAENGGDVQGAVGWLLQQAHEESKQKARSEAQSTRKSPPGAGRSPPSRQRNEQDGMPSWMKQERSNSAARRQDGRSPATGERDTTQMASEFGSKLFKSANSIWKASQKQMAKTMSEFQQERDASQPKWMQETTSGESSRASSQPRQQGRAAARSNEMPTTSMTDEAAALDAPREARPGRFTPSERQTDPPVRGRAQADAPQQRATAQPKFMQQQQQQQQPVFDKRPSSKLSKQDVEDQTAQAYVSPARRKRPTPKPEPQPEPQVDLFSPAPAKPTPSASNGSTKPPTTASRPSAAPPPRPTAPARNVPSVSPAALSTSAAHRKKGGEAFKRGDYAAAHDSYTAALSPLPAGHPIAIIVFSNRALTALKTGDAKIAVSDADRALELIGVSQGVGETIDLGAGEGTKDMRDFFGKALMRKAEALEHMEKWSEAAAVWRQAISSNVGGAISLRGRDRCEKSAAPKPKAAPVRSFAPSAGKPPPAKSLGNSLQRPGLSSASSAQAVKALRAANVAAEKADDEKFALTDQVDARLTAWKGGKADNLRALLQSLDGVLWPEAGWKKVGMGDLVMPNKVKINYMKAIAKVHPDKIPQDATTEQRMISAAVFSTLNEAWDKFKKDNNL